MRTGMIAGPVLALLFVAGLTGGVGPATAHGPEPHMDTNYDGHAKDLGHPGDPKARARVVQIIMNDTMRFAPSTLTINQGETVEFIVRNAGQLKHEIMLGTQEELVAHAALMVKFPEMEHDDPNGVSLDPGKSGRFRWTFTRPGNFLYGCLIGGHYEAGMRGSIVVRPRTAPKGG